MASCVPVCIVRTHHTSRAGPAPAHCTPGMTIVRWVCKKRKSRLVEKAALCVPGVHGMSAYAKLRSNSPAMAFLPFSSRKRVPVPVKCR